MSKLQINISPETPATALSINNQEDTHRDPEEHITNLPAFKIFSGSPNTQREALNSINHSRLKRSMGQLNRSIGTSRSVLQFDHQDKEQGQMGPDYNPQAPLFYNDLQQNGLFSEDLYNKEQNNDFQGDNMSFMSYDSGSMSVPMPTEHNIDRINKFPQTNQQLSLLNQDQNIAQKQESVNNNVDDKPKTSGLIIFKVYVFMIIYAVLSIWFLYHTFFNLECMVKTEKKIFSFIYNHPEVAVLMCCVSVISNIIKLTILYFCCKRCSNKQNNEENEIDGDDDFASFEDDVDFDEEQSDMSEISNNRDLLPMHYTQSEPKFKQVF